MEHKFDRLDGFLRCSCGWSFVIDDFKLEGYAFRMHLEEVVLKEAK